MPKKKAKKAEKPAKVVKKATKKKRPAPKKAKRPQVKLVRKALTKGEERKVNALIARVYQRAAEELRRVEEAAAAAKKKLFANAARELALTEEKFSAK